LRLAIEPPSIATVVNEPLPVRLTLTNEGSADLPVPTDYRDADIVTFTLYDDAGHVLATADGYTSEERIGGQPARVRQEAMHALPLPAGRAMQWASDLLEYLDLHEPGHYAIEARFAFRPSAIDLRSARAAFTVAPNRCRWLAFHADQVAIALVMYLERHAGDGGTRTLVHFARPDEPTHFWKGYVVDVPPTAPARLAQADFMTLDTFEHDFQRWIAWVEEGAIGGLRLDEEGKEMARLQATVGVDGWMAGNPVQHRDQGVSVVVLGKQGDGYTLTAYRFAAGGTAQGRRVAGTYSGEPAPLVTSTDWHGNLYAVSGRAGRLPLDLLVASGGAATRHTLLDPTAERSIVAQLRDAEVLALRADTSLVVAKMRAVLALLRAGEGERQRLIFARVGLADDGSPAGVATLAEAVFPADLLASDETLAAAVVAQGGGGLHAAVTTSRGRVLYVTPGQAARPVAEVPIEALGQADLLLAGGGVYLVHPTATQGMRHTVIQGPVARP
jgi:hypothetical protein